MRYAWFVILIAGLRFAFAAVRTLPRDGDLGWQRWLGRTILATHRIPRALGAETFTAPGAPWTPHEWLFSLIVLRTDTPRGWGEVAFGVAGCAMLALLLIALRAARSGAAPWLVAAATALAAMGMYNAFGMRAQVLGWPLLAAFMWALDAEGAWMWAAVPIAALWSNLHASVMLAPIIATLTAAGRWSEDRAWTPRVRLGVMVGVGTMIAVCCNPLGIGLPLYALSLFTAPLKIYIEEWQATDISRYGFAFGALPLLFGASIVGVSRGRRYAQDALIFAAFAFLLLFARRNIALFAIAIAPLVAREVTSVFSRRDAKPGSALVEAPPRAFRLPPKGFVFAWTIAAITFGMTIAIAWGSTLEWSGDRLEAIRPSEEIAWLRADPRNHRVYCADFAWCSFLLDVPRVRVFLDGRADPYPFSVWSDFATITYLRPHWRERLDADAIDAVVVLRGEALDQALAEMPRWSLATSDRRYDLWVRR